VKTRFDLQMTIRISINGCGQDRFTEKEIKNSLANNKAYISKGSFSYFIIQEQDGAVMAEVENIK